MKPEQMPVSASREQYEKNEDRLGEIRQMNPENTEVEELLGVAKEVKDIKKENEKIFEQDREEALAENEKFNQEKASVTEQDAIQLAEVRGKIEQASLEEKKQETGKEEEVSLSSHERKVMVDFSLMLDRADFGGAFKLLEEEIGKAEKIKDVDSGEAGFFKKMFAPKRENVCDVEKIEELVRDIVGKEITKIINNDDVNKYKKLVSAGEGHSEVGEKMLGNLSRGIMDGVEPGEKIRAFNFKRAVAEVGSYDPNHSNVRVDVYMDRLVGWYGNNNPAFKEELSQSAELKKKMSKYLEDIIKSQSSVPASVIQENIQSLVTSGYVSSKEARAFLERI